MSEYKRGKHPNSLKNLEKGKRFTAETATEKGKKGAEASHIVQEQKKTFAAIAEKALIMKPTPKTEDFMRELGYAEEEITQKAACVLAMIKEAQKGNVKAFEKLQELLGELQQEEKADNGILEALLEWMKGRQK